MENNWYLKSAAETIKLLRADEAGLSFKEAAERLKKHGANQLLEPKADGLMVIFFTAVSKPFDLYSYNRQLDSFFHGRNRRRRDYSGRSGV
jgi:magnesium-transporting ATPase (P-type)